MKKLTDFELGYIAAFLDGEGSISISKCNSKYGRMKTEKTYYRASITFYNTHKETMDWICGKLGIKARDRGIDSRINRRKNYAGSIRKQKDVYDFLQLMTPYLKIKQEQAKVMFEFVAFLIGRKQRIFSDANYLYLKNSHTKISKLNRGC